MQDNIKALEAILYTAILFVFFNAVYMPSTPIAGIVNSGKGENIFMPTANSGLFNQIEIGLAKKNRLKENTTPNNKKIRVNPLTNDFCSLAFILGMK